MFQNANKFNQDISSCDVSNVTNMSYMFKNASAFNKNIGSWKTDNVTNMSGMFQNASAFNQDISSWNTRKVEDMSYMFNGASVFNQDITSWYLLPRVNVTSMFLNAYASKNSYPSPGFASLATNGSNSIITLNRDFVSMFYQQSIRTSPLSPPNNLVPYVTYSRTQNTISDASSLVQPINTNVTASYLLTSPTSNYSYEWIYQEIKLQVATDAAYWDLTGKSSVTYTISANQEWITSNTTNGAVFVLSFSGYFPVTTYKTTVSILTAGPNKITTPFSSFAPPLPSNLKINFINFIVQSGTDTIYNAGAVTINGLTSNANTNQIVNGSYPTSLTLGGVVTLQ